MTMDEYKTKLSGLQTKILNYRLAMNNSFTITDKLMWSKRIEETQVIIDSLEKHKKEVDQQINNLLERRRIMMNI